MAETAGRGGLHAPLGGEAARAAFIAWVHEAAPEPRIFLEAHVRATAPGRYEVRHAADAMRPYASLQLVSADAYEARAIAQTTREGEHRPLKTSPNLRRGWALTDLDERGLGVAMDYLYPACVAHWHAGRTGTLRVTPWAETARRQSGIYAAVGLLGRDVLRDAVWACCDDVVCLRHVAWTDAGDKGAPAQRHPAGSGAGDLRAATVPCPEACSVFVSFARTLVQIEREPRRDLPGLAPLSETETEQLRQLAGAAAYPRVVGAEVREAEFDAPLNRRRIRYLAARLGAAAA